MLFFEALINRARVYSLIGNHEIANVDYCRAKKSAEDTKGVISSDLGLAELFLKGGKPEKSAALLKKTLQYAKKKKVRNIKGAILNGLCNVKMMESRTKEAEQYAREALHFFKNIYPNSNEKKKGIAESLNNLGGVYSSQGHFKQALSFYKQSYAARKNLQDREGEAITLNNIGVAHMDIREYRKALNYLKRSLEIRRTIGYIYGIALCSSNIAIVYWKQGKYDEALHFAGENLKQQIKLGDKWGRATSLSNIAVIHKVHGKYDKAIAYHRQSFDLRREIGDRFGMTINLNQMGHIYLKRGNYREALKSSDMERKLCNEIKNEPRLMNHYRLRGNILSEQGHYMMAYRYIEKSLAINKKLGLSIDEARDFSDLSYIIIAAHFSEGTFRFPINMAKEFLARSLRIVKAKQHQFECSIVLSRLSLLSAMENRQKDALTQIAEAERIAGENNFREFEPEMFFIKATVLAMQGRKSDARVYLNRGEKKCREMGVKSMIRKNAGSWIKKAKKLRKELRKKNER